MKAEKATIERRVEEILAIRIDGAMFWDIRQYVAEKEAKAEPPWTIPDGGGPVSERQLRRYIARSDVLIAREIKASRPALIGRHLIQRRSLYAKALSQGDIRAALACVKDEAELLSLYQRDDGDDGTEIDPDSMTDERADAILEADARPETPESGPDSSLAS